jgi:hypothetical protein
MTPSQIKNTNVVDNMDDGEDDFAVGSVEDVPNYTIKTFYRSVLFQMVLFGA